MVTTLISFFRLFESKSSNKSYHTKTDDQILNDDRTTTDNVKKGAKYD